MLSAKAAASSLRIPAQRGRVLVPAICRSRPVPEGGRSLARGVRAPLTAPGSCATARTSWLMPRVALRCSGQVPQFLYEAGYGCAAFPERCGVVGVTQPRRVAAVSTAARVAEEMGGRPGQTVGYQARPSPLPRTATRSKLLIAQPLFET